MITFICLFFPAVITVWIFEIITKKKVSFKELLYRFCFNTTVINFFCFFMKKFIFDTATQPLYSTVNDMLPSTAFNYLITTLPIVVILVLTQVLVSKRIQISVEENYNDK